MGKRLRVPAVLAVATLGTAAATTIALVASCGGDDAPQDASSCAVFCVAPFDDAGPPPPDGGCPACAELQGGTYVCPTGCTPLG